ncbi:MAG: hypothetical protein M3R15_25965 [Acidobacteriota bacterium]|nr:hypothetical protein [Acidobacteriota bacterium]
MATASVELEAQIADTSAVSSDEGSHHIPANDTFGEAANAPERIIDLIADPDTVEANRKLLGALGVCVVIILVQAAFNFVLYLRRPDAIVVDRTAGGDRVVVMNNREYGVTDNVRFTPDEPSVGDKKYLAARFLQLYYANNPDIRDRQLNEAIGLMIAVRGREFFEYLRRNRILEREATESWQATWTPQQTWIDNADPFTVHVIGTQALTRIVEQRAVDETRQLNITVKLARDELGRAERNGRTGYQVTWFGWENLNAPAPPMPAPGTAGMNGTSGVHSNPAGR